MKRTLIATVLSVTLVTGFGISDLSAGELDRLASLAAEGSLPKVFNALDGSHEAIARRGGGGGRRGGGMRRSGGVRRGGTRTASRSAGRSGGARRSTGGRSQHASNSRANHSKTTHASKGGTSNGKGTKNSHASKGDHSNHHGGHGWDGRSWDGGGWNWGADVVVPVRPVVPVVPVVPTVITLLNPAGTRTSLAYTFGASQYVIAAGETATFEDGTQAIAFDRGASFGQAHYTLEPGGAYKFVATENGWDLHKVTSDTVAESDATVSGSASALEVVGN
jgi:hypothetical protein